MPAIDKSVRLRPVQTHTTESVGAGGGERLLALALPFILKHCVIQVVTRNIAFAFFYQALGLLLFLFLRRLSLRLFLLRRRGPLTLAGALSLQLRFGCSRFLCL